MVTKTIDKAHEVNLFFSPTGNLISFFPSSFFLGQNLLIWAQTFTDRTGQSYYGEHMLLYLDVNMLLSFSEISDPQQNTQKSANS